MNFELTDEQVALRDLATQILTERSTHERLNALDASGTWFDGDTWRELVDAGLVGIALPESAGGGGLSFLDLHFVLEQVGATAAHVPLWEAVVLGALPIATFGSADQVQAYVAPVAAGDALLTAALSEDGRDDVRAPATTATAVDGGWRLEGTKTGVPIAAEALRILVPARTDDGRVGIFLVAPDADGVTLTEQSTSSRKPHFLVELGGVVVSDDDVLGSLDSGREVLDHLALHATAGICSMQSGTCQTALRMSATYTSEREQFGVKIATFQAVGQRVADAYIDTEGVRLTALQAAWRLAEGLPAEDAVSIAKFWSAEGGHRVAHAAQHVHVGVGIDHDYPLHRFFRVSTEHQFMLGAGTKHLLDLGRRLAAEPV